MIPLQHYGDGNNIKHDERILEVLEIAYDY